MMDMMIEVMSIIMIMMLVGVKGMDILYDYESSRNVTYKTMAMLVMIMMMMVVVKMVMTMTIMIMVVVMIMMMMMMIVISSYRLFLLQVFAYLTSSRRLTINQFEVATQLLLILSVRFVPVLIFP